jgi:hypothetical protein
MSPAVEPGASLGCAARVPLLLLAPTALGFSHEARAVGPVDVEIGAKVVCRKQSDRWRVIVAWWARPVTSSTAR